MNKLLCTYINNYKHKKANEDDHCRKIPLELCDIPDPHKYILLFIISAISITLFPKGFLVILLLIVYYLYVQLSTITNEYMFLKYACIAKASIKSIEKVSLEHGINYALTLECDEIKQYYNFFTLYVEINPKYEINDKIEIVYLPYGLKDPVNNIRFLNQFTKTEQLFLKST